MKTILITGGVGFIGSHTAEHLLKRGDRVIALDAFNFSYDPIHKEHNAKLLQRHEQFRLVRGDIRDVELVEDIFATEKIDCIIHLAARAGVRPSLLEPSSYMDINITGTMNLLEAMRKHKVDHMVFASSSSVYGSRTEGPFRESDNVDIPASPYAATKKACELLCANWNYLYGTHMTCLRFFTVYGPRQRPEMAIHLFASKISNGEEITMFGDGSSIRDYTFIDDIVQGVVSAVDRKMGFKIINLGNSNPIRLDDLIKSIAEVVQKDPIIKQLPDQPGDVPMTFADVSKAKELLDYNPQTRIVDGIHKFWIWKQTYQVSHIPS
jgi:UDP-glucuronate 4-epimerase